MAAPLRLRPAEPSDTPAICALLGEVFADNPKREEPTYAWQYWDNPFGPPAVWVWEDSGGLVGHGGIYATPGRVGSRTIRLGHTADAAIAGSHRGRGLFAELARARYDSAAAHGYHATWSFPNPAAVAGNVRGGLSVIDRVGAWVRPLDDAWVARRLHVPRPAATLGRRAGFRTLPVGGGVVEAVPEGLDALWERCGTGDGVVRSQAWWQWRYTTRPGAAYRFVEVRRSGRLTAAAAFAETVRDGTPFRYVHELLAEDAGAARVAVGTIETAPGAAAALVLLALPGSAGAATAQACGFRRLPRRLEPRPMVLGVVSHDETLGTAAWEVTWGDHDHV